MVRPWPVVLACTVLLVGCSSTEQVGAVWDGRNTLSVAGQLPAPHAIISTADALDATVWLEDGFAKVERGDTTVDLPGGYPLVAADFDSDGMFDVAVTEGTSRTLLYYAGEPETPLAFEWPGAVGGLSIGDLWGDGWVDLVALVAVEKHAFSHQICFAAGTSTGFGEISCLEDLTVLILESPWLGGIAAAIGDVDGDSFDDLVVGVGPDLVVRHGDGGVPWTTETVLLEHVGVDAVAIHELNGDDVHDIAVIGTENVIFSSQGEIRELSDGFDGKLGFRIIESSEGKGLYVLGWDGLLSLDANGTLAPVASLPRRTRALGFGWHAEGAILADRSGN